MRLVPILLLSVVALLGALQTAKAATITSATSNKETYLAGQTGYISATIYNEETQKIRVTELSGIVDYFYTDGTAYVQRFFTNAELPIEIQPGQSEIIQIPISLPTNIASGYFNLRVEAKTDLWVNQTQRWFSSDQPAQEVKLFIETPYKQSYEDSQDKLQDAQSDLQASNAQLQEQKSVSQNLSNTALALGVATFAFVGIAAFLMFALLRRPKPLQEIPS
jgi:hypothetical protein